MFFKFMIFGLLAIKQARFNVLTNVEAFACEDIEEMSPRYWFENHEKYSACVFLTNTIIQIRNPA